MSECMTDSNPFPIGLCDAGFSLYLPPYQFDEAQEMKTVNAANRKNREFSSVGATLPPAVPQHRISGTFIYAHPADYMGRPMLKATQKEWEALFDECLEMGMDTVIFQAALWRELGECFYLSRRYADMKRSAVVETMLAAAAEKKISVYLGGYGSVAGWSDRLSETRLLAEIQEHRACFKEISKLGRFAGCYFPCETAYHGTRNPEAECRMNRLYRSFCETVKEFNPKLQVIVSPAGKLYPGKKAEFLQFWHAVLSDSLVDVLMPQDTIGNCLCTLGDLPEIWQWWKEAADHDQIRLWGHIELFERRSFLEKINLFPASPERVASQVALASAVVEKMIAWEAPYFASCASGAEGKRLQEYFKKTIQQERQGK